MRLRLTPRRDSFYELFTASANNLVEGVRLLGELIAAPASERPALAVQVRDCEHAGDELTHAILREVNSTFVTPFDREDIYRLASRLDDVMDYMEAASDLIVLSELGDLPEEVTGQVRVLERAAAVTAAAMPRLRSMRDLADFWIEVNRLENEGDQLYRRFLARLFGGEYDALTVLKLKEVTEQLEAAADAFENVGDTVESIAVKES